MNSASPIDIGMILLIISLLGMAIGLFAAQQAYARFVPKIDEIMAADLQQLIQNYERIIVIDIRPNTDLSAHKSLRFVSHIPMTRLEARLPKLFYDVSDPFPPMVILIGKDHFRSRIAARFVLNAGFTDVKILKGGMMAWEMNLRQSAKG